MITRALFLSVGWLAISLLGLFLLGKRIKWGHPFISVSWLVTVILIGDAWALLTFGVIGELILVSVLALLAGLFVVLWRNSWNALGQTAWAMSILTLFFFIIYSFTVTAFTPLNPLAFVLALLFFFLEVAGLLLVMTYLYQGLDVATRIHWQRRIHSFASDPNAKFTPAVALHVLIDEQPFESAAATLRSLARLDYPNYQVLVIDANIANEEQRRKIELLCWELGQNFRFLHLEKWPGFWSGELNFALAQTEPKAAIIAVVNAGDEVYPAYLKDLVPAFYNPQVAFVQTPLDNREWQDHPYLEPASNGRQYFYQVSLPSRNEHNAVALAGGLKLIRKSALQEIGGWDEWCLTEQSEAGLRMLMRGYEGLFVNQPYARNRVLPDIAGLKKQIFRSAFGGMQILRKHWEALMPWAGWVDPENKLTNTQRLAFLTGGLQWFTDIFNLLVIFFLLLGAILSLFAPLLRPLAGPLLVLPIVYVCLHLWRYLWALRSQGRISLLMALRALYSRMSMSWTAALACLQGLIQPIGVFLQMPKAKPGARVLRAFRYARPELIIGLAALVAGILAFIVNPGFGTGVLAALLVWQASLFLYAPLFSLRGAPAISNTLSGAAGERGRSIREGRSARWIFGLGVLALLVGAGIHFLPPPQATPSYASFQPPTPPPPQQLVGMQQVPLDQRANPSTDPGLTLPYAGAQQLNSAPTTAPTVVGTEAVNAAVTEPVATPAGVAVTPAPTVAVPTPRPPAATEPTGGLLPPYIPPPPKATRPPTQPPPTNPPPTDPPPTNPPPTNPPPPPPTDPPPTNPPPSEPPPPTDPPPGTQPPPTDPPPTQPPATKPPKPTKTPKPPKPTQPPPPPPAGADTLNLSALLWLPYTPIWY